jgi:hypothetical protein
MTLEVTASPNSGGCAGVDGEIEPPLGSMSSIPAETVKACSEEAVDTVALVTVDWPASSFLGIVSCF